MKTTFRKLGCPLLLLLLIFPSIRTFQMSQQFASDAQNIGAPASESVLPMNSQAWFPLGLTNLISLLFRWLSRVFSITTVSRHQFFSLCLLYSPALAIVCDHWENQSLDDLDLCQQSNVSAFNILSRFVIAFLPRRNCLLISWLLLPSAVILEPQKRKSVTTSTFSPPIYHE